MHYLGLNPSRCNPENSCYQYNLLCGYLKFCKNKLLNNTATKNCFYINLFFFVLNSECLVCQLNIACVVLQGFNKAKSKNFFFENEERFKTN
ncbi:hypothetical protein BpHYR1_050714 [Brachionus plicatilis]|uniref:Uncharacterized protein n=1 Tax=Brachionus plicatilis TaxID=10195 RepID=A0A3M7T251_BRAPC|nr:hypothetical protein BpHYR1_050714 [Brachionus plicatilis]